MLARRILDILRREFRNDRRSLLDAAEAARVLDVADRHREQGIRRTMAPKGLREIDLAVGVAVQWLAPLGLFRFSYAYPLNPYKENDRYFGDVLERFQFSIGQAF